MINDAQWLDDIAPDLDKRVRQSILDELALWQQLADDRRRDLDNAAIAYDAAARRDAEHWREARRSAIEAGDALMAELVDAEAEVRRLNAELAEARRERDRLRAEVAALASELEKVADWMTANSYATGHGDSIEGLLGELAWQIKEQRERAALEGKP